MWPILPSGILILIHSYRWRIRATLQALTEKHEGSVERLDFIEKAGSAKGHSGCLCNRPESTKTFKYANTEVLLFVFGTPFLVKLHSSFVAFRRPSLCLYESIPSMEPLHGFLSPYKILIFAVFCLTLHAKHIQNRGVFFHSITSSQNCQNMLFWTKFSYQNKHFRQFFTATWQHSKFGQMLEHASITISSNKKNGGPKRLTTSVNYSVLNLQCLVPAICLS